MPTLLQGNLHVFDITLTFLHNLESLFPPPPLNLKHIIKNSELKASCAKTIARPGYSFSSVKLHMGLKGHRSVPGSLWWLAWDGQSQGLNQCQCDVRRLQDEMGKANTKCWDIRKCLRVEESGKASQPMTPVMHGGSGLVYIQDLACFG